MTEDLYHPHRPPRLERVFQCMTPFYFVTFNTHARRPLLATRDLHAAFDEFCHKAEKFNVAVGRYVIMPDHIHLFAMLPPGETTLSRWVQSLKSVLGKELLRQGQAKPHWQEGFFDHLLRSGESYIEKWNYVRLNPVRAGFAATPEEWPYQGEVVFIRW